MANILIIDDDAEMLQTLTEILSQIGHSVLSAANGKLGSQLLDRGGFDLVITDIYMPEGEGLELIVAVRKTHPDMKIIAISGRHGTMNMLPVAQKLGVSHTLAKPFTPRELLKMVEQVLKA
jgi:DNA-binding NtrC family response regulator